jgi:hypothetical protein
MSLSDKLQHRTFPTKDVTLCLDAALSAERDAAMAELVKAKDADSGRLAGNGTGAIQKRITEIESRMRDSLVTLRITGLPFADYNKAVHANPPRKGRQETFNPTTFFLYVARKSTQYIDEAGAAHDITGEEWDRIESGLTDGEHDNLATAVIEVNRTQGLQGVGFLGRASEKITGSLETSGSPELSE